MSTPGHAAFEPLVSLQDAVSRCLQLPGSRSMFVLCSYVLVEGSILSQNREDTLRAAISVIRLSGTAELRVLNDAAPINLLPDHLLFRIFCYTTDGDRRSASHVCQRWRSTFAEGVRRPRDIESLFTNGAGLAAASVSLGCLPDSPFSLSLLISTECDALGDLLPYHMAHIRHLSIQIMPSLITFDGHQLFRPLVRALEVPAPALEELDLWSIQRSWIAGDDNYLSEHLFDDSAPLLHSVRLHGFALHDRVYPALTGIRRLSVSQFSVDLSHILAFYPQLEQLHIDVINLVSSAEGISHRLHLLHIRGLMQTAEIVRTQLRSQQPLSVWLEGQGEDQFAYILSHLPRQDAVRVQILFDAIRAQTVCVLAVRGGWTWVIDFLPEVSPLAVCDDDVVASITELRIHELAWPRLPADVPRALHLTHLELILYGWLRDPGTVAGIFFDDADDRHCVLQCPALEQLSLFSRSGSPLVVDVFDVLHFISTRLRFAPEPLGRLRLRNVSLHSPMCGRGMEALTARVRRIEYCTVGEPDIPYIHQKSGSMFWIYSMMGSEDL